MANGLSGRATSGTTSILETSTYKAVIWLETNPAYYGFMNSDGGWFIQKITTTGDLSESDFIKGDSNFDIAWTNRESLNYDSYDNVF